MIVSTKKHRVAGKLFRDIIETLDLAAYSHSKTPQSESNLEKWYGDEIVSHGVYRDYLKKTQGEEAFEESRRHYKSLSRFTHRTYRAILDGYVRGREDVLFHDGYGFLYRESKDTERNLVLPHTIASYYASLANLVLIFSDEITRKGLVKLSEVRHTLQESLEDETVPRRFMPRDWIKRTPEPSSE